MTFAGSGVGVQTRVFQPLILASVSSPHNPANFPPRIPLKVLDQEAGLLK